MTRHLLVVLALLGAVGLMSISSPGTIAQAAGTIQGIVKDPNGAVVAGAPVAVRHETTGATQSATTDREGRFTIAGLAPGRYTVSVAARGFKPAEPAVAVEAEKKASIEIRLEVAETRAELSVGAKGAIAANAETNYRALREAKPGETFSVSNLSLKRDIGILMLRSGTITFLAPVLDRPAVGVFVGEGEFTLAPAV